MIKNDFFPPQDEFNIWYLFLFDLCINIAEEKAEIHKIIYHEICAQSFLSH
jgi:hypothetical protein